jgi:hypothetical protein
MWRKRKKCKRGRRARRGDGQRMEEETGRGREGRRLEEDRAEGRKGRVAVRMEEVKRWNAE